MGGIAGHAGLFAPLVDMASFATNLLVSTKAETSSAGNSDLNNIYSSSQGTVLLNRTTAQLFTTVRNASLSSRALGWDTNLENVTDFGFDGVCGSILGPRTFLHIGYSGTCLCVDPVAGFWSVVLTNRVYNCQGQLCPQGSEDAVKGLYRKFNTAAAAHAAAARKRGL